MKTVETNKTVDENNKIQTRKTKFNVKWILFILATINVVNAFLQGGSVVAQIVAGALLIMGYDIIRGLIILVSGIGILISTTFKFSIVESILKLDTYVIVFISIGVFTMFTVFINKIFKLDAKIDKRHNKKSNKNKQKDQIDLIIL